MRLLYSARSLEGVIAREWLLGQQRGIEVTVALTRTVPEGWTGLVGRLDPGALRAAAIPAGSAPQVFVCGPTAFVEAVTSALVELGHAPDVIKTERFGATGGTP